MPGKILIADDSATNRILLKAKLTAAYHQVIIADTAEDLIALANHHNPDLFLVAGNMFDEKLADKLRNIRKFKNQPILVLLSESNPTQRLNALIKGADDVICHPFDEPVLLARLRNHLRTHIADRDLRENMRAAEGLGFSDASQSFVHPMQIALFAKRTDTLDALGGALASLGSYDLLRYRPDKLTSLTNSTPQADVYLLSITDIAKPESDLRLLARLSSESSSRSYRILAYLHQSSPSVTSTLLDLGANDVVDVTASLEELALRIHLQAQNKHRVDEMRSMLRKRLDAAMIDPLTGLHNRRYALPFLQQQIESARLSGRHFTVMLADLDHFKRINDQYGHVAGDMVLKHVAKELRGTLEDHDMIARIGGEEFMIILPEASQEKARDIATTLRKKIREMPVTVLAGDTPVHVTISIGVTFAPHESDHTGPCTVDAILEQTDKALYRAKSMGRNTVTLNMLSAA